MKPLLDTTMGKDSIYVRGMVKNTKQKKQWSAQTTLQILKLINSEASGMTISTRLFCFLSPKSDELQAA